MMTSRAHAGEYARRVNRAMELLDEGKAPADAARQLARQYRLSVRQGWRYVREATGRSDPLAVAERKVVFTVKLPENLLRQVRAAAASRGTTLSALVSEALEEWLGRLRRERRRGGQKG